ncbi:uncharacterized protein LOC126777066 isoform X2 [Nymphalis io]|nr:uncharacterized protein LOC126777066 isoform X2 [Nymphalis io]
MFGHFKDAIRDIDVGMEGRGSWRSKATPCSPGVHYQRGTILCVCDQDGNWPNPVCRDIFRVLHSVELTGKTTISSNESCTPTKLYLIGCNVCFCPSTGSLDPALCTKKECDEGDPALEVNDGPALIADSQKNNKDIKNIEVYATCNIKIKYQLGCMKCDCIGNNRLICEKCKSENENNMTIINQQPIARKNYKSYCNGKKIGEIFKIVCNYCHCDRKLNLYCTAKKCIQPRNVKLKSQFKLSKTIKLRNAKPPPDEQSCLSGTQYKIDCNTCKCVKLRSGIKVVDCTLKNCSNQSPIESQKHDCVEGLYYELDCKLCYCYIEDKIKHQVCQIHDNCVQNLVIKERMKPTKLKSVESQNGYCEPLHEYQNNCNVCRCLSDGKTYMCTSRVCIKRSTDTLSVNIVPVHMENEEACPVGHSYKLDCNLCFCLSNGNAICTTNNCVKEYV